MFSHMRIARPVTDLARACAMYSQGLELQRIADFTDHAGFSGIMVGRPELAWHIEFTHCHDHPRQPARPMKTCSCCITPIKQTGSGRAPE